jgi:hypothetical protein
MSALREMQTAPEALPTVLTSLPPLLARRVFLAVPADARGRACCVCRAWRDALVDAWFWTRVDLTPEGGVAGRRADDKEKAMLLAAVGRARWQLEALCVSHISDLPTLLEVLRDNALSLRELSVGSSYHDPPTLEALVAAAPQLRTLNAWTRCSVTEAPRLLRAESPLKCLTLHNIWLEYGFHDLKDAEAAAPDGVGRRLFDALGDPLVQPSLLRIDMRHLGSWQPITTTALVDSLRARRLRVLQFDSCAPFPAELLARMIVGGALTELRISGHHYPRVLFAFWKEPLYDPPHAILVAAALRATTTLTILEFCHTNLAIKDAGAAMILLNALVGHNTLRSLTVREALMGPVQARLLGTVLGNIVAADAPTLATLCVAGPWQRYDPFMQLLNEDGLKPILDALPRNRHLLKLDISHNEMGTAFARNELLRAVRANRSLRELTYELYVIFPQPGAREAMELVRRRSH